MKALFGWEGENTKYVKKPWETKYIWLLRGLGEKFLCISKLSYIHEYLSFKNKTYIMLIA
jgi:hypothetical protein